MTRGHDGSAESLAKQRAAQVRATASDIANWLEDEAKVLAFSSQTTRLCQTADWVRELGWLAGEEVARLQAELATEKGALDAAAIIAVGQRDALAEALGERHDSSFVDLLDKVRSLRVPEMARFLCADHVSGLVPCPNCRPAASSAAPSPGDQTPEEQ